MSRKSFGLVIGVIVLCICLSSTITICASLLPQSVSGQFIVGQRDNYNYMEYLIDNDGNGKPERLSITRLGRPTGFIHDIVAQIDDLNGDGYADRMIVLNLSKHTPEGWFDSNEPLEYTEVTFLEDEKFPVDKFTAHAVFMLYVTKLGGRQV